jgi:ATP-binding cassette subfamily F protein uup
MSTNPPLISTQEITKGFSEKPLFSKLSLGIHEQERLALIGNNGSGKSTLLKILAGLEEVDGGVVTSRKGIRCAYVAQQDFFEPGLSVEEVVERSLQGLNIPDSEIARRVNQTLGIAGFDDRSMSVSSLSGGWKKRLSIAASLAQEPDCLLLDEPTNHLDIDAILWLEDLLIKSRCTTVFVSHDRYFIENLATRVIELNPAYPNNLLESEGGYADHIEHREMVLEQLTQQRQSLANKVRREVEWLRQGVKARTTKSRARINEAHKLIDTLKSSSSGEGKRTAFEFSSTQRKTKELLKTEEIAQELGGKALFSNVSLVLSPGSRLAIVGPNGSGKTTFINTVLGSLNPSAGLVRRAPNLRTTFMDQGRTQLQDDMTLREFLCPHGDSVHFRGEMIHVAAWASRFLFSHNHLATRIGSLSGGERARALLAKSLAEESDILLFDEPTNDLDIATLENLEESFESFPGAIVLITHDRYLLERTGSAVLGLGDGKGALYGDYAQWESARREVLSQSQQKREAPKKPGVATQPKTATKLSYKDARDLASIEAEIAKAEEKLADTQRRLDSGEFATNAIKLGELCDTLSAQQADVEKLYERWQHLETLRASLPQKG